MSVSVCVAVSVCNEPCGFSFALCCRQLVLSPPPPGHLCLYLSLSFVFGCLCFRLWPTCCFGCHNIGAPFTTHETGIRLTSLKRVPRSTCYGGKIYMRVVRGFNQETKSELKKVRLNLNRLSIQMVVPVATRRPIWLSDGLVAHAKSQNKQAEAVIFDA